MRELYNGMEQTRKLSLRFETAQCFFDVERERAINNGLIRRSASWARRGDGETEKLAEIIEIFFELLRLASLATRYFAA